MHIGWGSVAYRNEPGYVKHIRSKVRSEFLRMSSPKIPMNFKKHRGILCLNVLIAKIRIIWLEHGQSEAAILPSATHWWNFLPPILHFSGFKTRKSAASVSLWVINKLSGRFFSSCKDVGVRIFALKNVLECRWHQGTHFSEWSDGNDIVWEVKNFHTKVIFQNTKIKSRTVVTSACFCTGSRFHQK